MTEAPENGRYTFDWIRVGDLVVKWTEAQRKLGERRAQEIAAEFDADLFGTLTVIPIAHGKYHVADGWTRATAIKFLYGDKERVPCMIVPASNGQRAAQIFRGINAGRAKPQAMELFKVSVIAGDGPEVVINKIANEIGLHIDNLGSDGHIRAVGALMAIYKQTKAVGLRTTLLTIRGIWGLDASAYDAYILRGVSAFLTDYGEAIDGPRLRTKVSKKWTPGRLISAARATQEQFGGSLARAACALIVQTYNSGTHHGRLGENEKVVTKNKPKAAHPSNSGIAVR